MTNQVPAVAHLRLDPAPTIVGSRCGSCGATYLLRRSACASCGGDDFAAGVDLGTTGVVTTATVVHRGMPGVPTPFTSGVVALDAGGFVRCTLTDAEDPVAAVGRRAVLETGVVGTDAAGTEAVAFTFRVQDIEGAPA
ncbi:hypothetical protein EFK50_11335 [Nocardioides marmoriginsengisoli]|uniref:DUF35 domain-containing protein n=1 Tax=Nocardioides marmoriginsengisoli TaxID=661483 RepID=A0A3N0CH73_9ACTN|nr:OB-fold domain-containing protein [Nocardioides marmoriginsengisoli]RNL62363.1 hypothetical protein EFK50_11335 [Nocardioides marmoriginsengisoli]